MLMAVAAWLRPLTLLISASFSHCHLSAIYDVLAFVYNVSIILNRWLTCFMTYKRCRCLFSTTYRKFLIIKYEVAGPINFESGFYKF